MIRHVRTSGGAILTRILRGGMLRLDPPGLEIDLSPLIALTKPRE
jgi:hypothetical protein